MATEAINNISTASSDGKVYTTVTPADNNGNSFKFPYNAAPSKNTIKEVSDPSRNIFVTKISNDNKYYFNKTYTNGYSNAVAINNEELIGGSKSSQFNDIRKLRKGTTLANCVGWAHGRVNEIWGTAVETGYIVKQGGNWVIPSKNNQIVKCSQDPSILTIPACNAYKFYDKWPSSDGWYKSEKYQDNQRPLPGAIICWENTSSSSGSYGHVAVVEAVYNYGLDTEYIVISQSYWTKTGAKKVAWTQVVNRKGLLGLWHFSNGYKFIGFLFSPVCQLLPGSYVEAKQKYTDEEIEVLKADIKKYKTISEALESSTVNKDIIKGQKVRIVWFGSKTKNETNSKINLLGGIGKVVKVNKLNAYPYAVSLTNDGEIAGYFTRDALKVEDDSWLEEI